jgi:hypothetical protein
VVRPRGLEPLRVSPLASKASASTSSATATHSRVTASLPRHCRRHKRQSRPPSVGDTAVRRFRQPMGHALCSCRSSPFLFAPVLFRLSFHGRCIRVLTGLLWLPKDTCHVAAGWALIRDQSWLTSDRRNPHHRVHCGFASRACHGAGFRKVRHATHTPCDRVSKPHSCKGNSLASGAFSHRKKVFPRPVC